MGRPIGPEIIEDDVIRCRKCGRKGKLSEFWRLVRHPFESQYYSCACNRNKFVAIKFPEDKNPADGSIIPERIELHELEAELLLEGRNEKTRR
jgi:hypothetical protein